MRRRVEIPGEVWADIVHRYRQGTSANQLAREHNLNSNTLHSKLRRAGYKLGDKRGQAQSDTTTGIYNTNIDGNDLTLGQSKEDKSNQLRLVEGRENKEGLGLHVQDQERQRLTLIRRHKTQANRIRKLLDRAMADAKANPLSVRDLDTLTRAHERLVRTDRLIFDIEEQAGEGSQTLVNKGVIVVPGKVDGSPESWAKAVAKVGGSDDGSTS